MMKIYYAGFFGSIIICIGTMFYFTPVFKNSILDAIRYEQSASKISYAVRSMRFTPVDKSDVPLRRYAGASTIINGNGNVTYTKPNAPHYTARARLAR